MQAMSRQLDSPHIRTILKFWTVDNRKAPWLLPAPRIPSLCHNSSLAKKLLSPGSRGPLPLTEDNLGVCQCAWRSHFQPLNPGSQELGPHQVRCEERTWRRSGAVLQQFQYTPGHHLPNWIKTTCRYARNCRGKCQPLPLSARQPWSSWKPRQVPSKPRIPRKKSVGPHQDGVAVFGCLG